MRHVYLHIYMSVYVYISIYLDTGTHYVNAHTHTHTEYVYIYTYAHVHKQRIYIQRVNYVLYVVAYIYTSLCSSAHLD